MKRYMTAGIVVGGMVLFLGAGCETNTSATVDTSADVRQEVPAGTSEDAAMMKKEEEPKSGEMMEKSSEKKEESAMMKKEAEPVILGADAMVSVEGSMAAKDESAMMKKNPGTYESYESSKLALANAGNVVLFFAADWCPTCRAADANLRDSAIPDGVHVLKVNYDTATDLKKKYGVTYQHTFVQVDAEGTQLKKWSNSRTIQEIMVEIQ